ncbi:hypothetical protein [uncultured Chitinophaga sp.]|uniref:hypothetical protein n=1 Tax=uncultured Chitinophaga sp. TaxID=339340 RepID=UPI0026353E9A|nr:hypothetical protein [uncultured Chitinophaga sp.]
MKGSKFWRWVFSPGGTTALLAFFWLIVYIINTSRGNDYLGIWPEPTIYWPLILVAIALIYAFTSGFRQWRTLHYMHVASLVMLPVLLFSWASAYGNTPEETYYFVNETARRQWEDRQRVINVLLKPASIFIFAAQIGFVVNIIAGFIRGKKSAS